MASTTILTLIDGVRIVVPDSLNLITPYVLMEQQDWFEDEIRFLRRLLRPGDRVIDVGANYGVYALSMAKSVGPSGRVWAFEPAAATAMLLAAGVAANGFSQVAIERCALSSRSGTAELSLDENSELNALVRGGSAAGARETVALSTLDECFDRHGWSDISFVKIDAEGEESNILKGGRRFFAELSPLVQYEIKADTAWHMELLDEFAACGYESYRLVPGLGLLVPFARGETPDVYLLNLFCCKPDRAQSVIAGGYLVASGPSDPRTEAGQAASKFDVSTDSGRHHWRRSLCRFPYGAQLAATWEKTNGAGNGRAEVNKALALYAASRDPTLSPAERFDALEGSFDLFSALCERQPGYLRLASLARVARDCGARAAAVQALQRLCDGIFRDKQVDLSEPFLSPADRFESLPMGATAGNWVLAAGLEEFERLQSFSSFYTGDSARKRLATIRNLGFGSAEMDRRLQLLQRRYDPPGR